VGLQGAHEEVLVVGDVHRCNGHIKPVTGRCCGTVREVFENLIEVKLAAGVVAVFVFEARQEPQSVGDALARRRRIRSVGNGLLGGRGCFEPNDVGHQ
jgi:hypothetical protein